MQFEEELARVLPGDVPHRQRLIDKAAQHLRLISAANEYMNLTRIMTPQEAAIKHIYDSVAPWRHFAGARRVLDAGTGAGFPGVPLAVVLPDVRFTLAESIQKKARFVDSVVESLDLGNVHVAPERAEANLLAQAPEIITARAVAPIHRLLDLFGRALKQGSRLLLYKGPEVEAELQEAQDSKVEAEILCRYELPDGLGTRTLVSIRLQGRGARKAS
ncbi:MAG: 16S rRNA (guanine(527)-N(7))-methyltransferase RsmG [Acidobacteriaceae bacterium]|nr:16S rRNA (guanine(527)-N(7))-methyltransferase RsmG [Acidobacteriaceae bacterium]